MNNVILFKIIKKETTRTPEFVRGDIFGMSEATIVLITSANVF